METKNSIEICKSQDTPQHVSKRLKFEDVDDFIKKNKFACEKLKDEYCKLYFDADFKVDPCSNEELKKIEKGKIGDCYDLIHVISEHYKFEFDHETLAIYGRESRKVREGDDVKIKVSFRFVVNGYKIKKQNIKKMLEKHDPKKEVFDQSVYCKGKLINCLGCVKIPSQNDIDPCPPLKKLNNLEDSKYFITNYDEYDEEIEVDDEEDDDSIDDENIIEENLNYNCKEHEILEYINLLSKDRAENYESWISVGFCLKNIGHVMNSCLLNAWITFSSQSKKFKKSECVKAWNTFKFKKDGFKLGSLLKWAKEDNEEAFILLVKKSSFKEFVPITLSSPHEIINYSHLTKWKPSHEICTKKHLIILSEGATGKTTMMCDYIKFTGLTFVSIVNQISLAEKHIFDFEEANINVINYQTMGKSDIDNKNSFVICVNSICKIQGLDITNKVLILDEVDSLVKHVLSHQDMKNRGDVFITLMKMLKTCKQSISIDADISDLVFILHENLTYHFIQNTYKSFQFIKDEYNNPTTQPIEAHEIKDGVSIVDQLVNEIRKGGRPMICSDSKTHITNLYYQLIKEFPEIKDTFKLYTKDTRLKIKNATLEWRDNIPMFSPKIQTGIDYVPTCATNVYSFCGMSQKTIDSRSRTQQIMRCRKINTIYYHWKENSVNPSKFRDTSHVKEYYQDNIKKFMVILKELGAHCINDEDENQVHENRYSKLLFTHEYIKDTLNTNRKAHYEIRLEKKGITIIKDNTPKNKIRKIEDDPRYKEAKSAILEDKDELIEKYINGKECDFEFKKEMDTKIGQVFNLDLKNKDLMRDYKDILFDEFQTMHHWAIRKILNPLDKLIYTIESKYVSDFKENILESVNAKVLIHFKICEILGVSGLDLNVDINTLDDKISSKDADEIFGLYQHYFRIQGKIVPPQTKQDLCKLRVKIIRSLTGIKIDRERTMINKIRYNIYKIENQSYYDHHVNLMKKSKEGKESNDFSIYEVQGCKAKQTSLFIKEEDDHEEELGDIIVNEQKKKYIKKGGEMIRIN